MVSPIRYTRQDSCCEEEINKETLTLIWNMNIMKKAEKQNNNRLTVCNGWVRTVRHAYK
jgi:hypothetical protein